MNLGFDFRSGGLGDLRDVLEGLVARINTVWKKQHNPDGTHSTVTADSVDADRVTVRTFLRVLPVANAQNGVSPEAVRIERTAQFGDIIEIDISGLFTPVNITGTALPVGGSGASSGIGLVGGVRPALANLSAAGVVVSASIDEAASGTHPTLSTLLIDGRLGATGGATVTRTAALQISAIATNPVTERNWAIYLDAGGVRVPDLIAADGGQIRFPATQVPSADPNTLDDYEEGAWTPVDASGAGLAFAAAAGTYVKNGRIVAINAVVVYPATASGVAAIIGGLPFPVPNIQGNGFAISFTTRATPFTAYAREATSRVELLNYGGAAVTNANMSGQFVELCGTYIAGQ